MTLPPVRVDPLQEPLHTLSELLGQSSKGWAIWIRARSLHRSAPGGTGPVVTPPSHNTVSGLIHTLPSQTWTLCQQRPTSSMTRRGVRPNRRSSSCNLPGVWASPSRRTTSWALRQPGRGCWRDEPTQPTAQLLQAGVLGPEFLRPFGSVSFHPAVLVPPSVPGRLSDLEMPQHLGQALALEDGEGSLHGYPLGLVAGEGVAIGEVLDDERGGTVRVSPSRLSRTVTVFRFRSTATQGSLRAASGRDPVPTRSPIKPVFPSRGCSRLSSSSRPSPSSYP